MKAFILLSSVFVVFGGISFADDVSEEWVARYDGPANYEDVAKEVYVDNAGNVYVTGYSHDIGYNKDYLTIKYDNNGNDIWVSRYDGPSSGNDQAYALFVDNIGNVYVTGVCVRYGGNDYCTIKYNNSGNEEWVVFYNGPGSNPVDIARDVSVDSEGNVYITGYSGQEGGPTEADYCTIKYDSEGNEEWIARYDGPGSDDDIDEATSIFVDDAGYVYVTGFSEGSSNNPDFCTIKYDNDGNEEWISRYNGSGNWYDGGIDICVDNVGNVYVFGITYNYGHTNRDFCTIKYASDGNEEWVATYDGPMNANEYGQDLFVDDLGNVYVTGRVYYSSQHYEDYGTIKYNSDGNEEWVAIYDGPGSMSCDTTYSVYVDNNYSVYVTGRAQDSSSSFYHTIKYDNTGSEIWSIDYSGPEGGNDAYCIFVDDDGYIYITGRSLDVTHYDYCTIKYWQTGVDINLVYFSAQFEGDAVKLNWSVETTEGEQIAGFNLYRRELTTEGDPAFGGVSPTESKDQFWEQVNDYLITGENPYTYTDSDVERGLAYEYKLSAVLADDSAETLGTTQATAGIPPASFAILALYPNPASDVLTCLLAVPEPGTVELLLYDLSGRLVLSKQFEASEPTELGAQLNISSLASGVYTLRVSFDGAEVSPACGGVAVLVR